MLWPESRHHQRNNRYDDLSWWEDALWLRERSLINVLTASSMTSIKLREPFWLSPRWFGRRLLDEWPVLVISRGFRISQWLEVGVRKTKSGSRQNNLIETKFFVIDDIIAAKVTVAARRCIWESARILVHKQSAPCLVMKESNPCWTFKVKMSETRFWRIPR